MKIITPKENLTGERLWNSRWTHWWFKKDSREAESMPACCMDPTFSGASDIAGMKRAAGIFRETGINVVLTEGLRRITLFEIQGKTPQVVEAVARAATACRKEGISMIHHLTASFAFQTLADCPESRREQLQIDAKTGGIAHLNWVGGWYFWCINHPDFRNEYFRLCRELVRETGVDGLMVDEVYFRAGWYSCSCKICRELFRRRTGKILPPADDAGFWGNFDNPLFRDWIRFRCECVGNFYADLQRELRLVSRNPVLLGCKNDDPVPVHAQGFGENNEERMRGTNVLFTESGGFANLHSLRRLAATFAVYNGFSNYYRTPTLAIMYYHNSPDELFFSWALRSVFGLRVWATANSSAGGELSKSAQLLEHPEDLRQFQALFAWEREHETELSASIEPFSDVAVMLSAATRDLIDHRNGWDVYVREFVGYLEALTDANCQFRVIMESELTPEQLGRYHLVILPNAVCLSSSDCRNLSDYVASGGGLIFTGQTGDRDETGGAVEGPNRLRTALHAGKQQNSGRYGKGRFLHFSEPLGRAVYTSINCSGRVKQKDVIGGDDAPPAAPVAAAAAQAKILTALNELNVRPFVRLQSPSEGILVKAYWRRDGLGIIVHFLNVSGGKLIKIGEHIPEDGGLAYPPLQSNVELVLRAASVQRACLFSPDWAGTVEIEPEMLPGDEVKLTLPAGRLHRYTVLCVDMS